jgi:hypothetical protein
LTIFAARLLLDPEMPKSTSATLNNIQDIRYQVMHFVLKNYNCLLKQLFFFILFFFILMFSIILFFFILIFHVSTLLISNVFITSSSCVTFLFLLGGSYCEIIH